MPLWHEELTEPILGAAFEVQGVLDERANCLPRIRVQSVFIRGFYMKAVNGYEAGWS